MAHPGEARWSSADVSNPYRFPGPPEASADAEGATMPAQPPHAGLLPRRGTGPAANIAVASAARHAAKKIGRDRLVPCSGNAVPPSVQ